MSRSVLAAACLLAMAGAPACRDRISPARREFDRGVDRYMKLRRTVAAGLPALKPNQSADEIAAHERELSGRIRQARAAAKQGDIFTPSVCAEFRRVLRSNLDPPEKQRVRRSLESAEPINAPAGVNEPYPPAAPLQSVPPTLLLNLPKLPPELRYEVMGHDLLLLDAGANLVVDKAEAVVP